MGISPTECEDSVWMRYALDLAFRAQEQNEVPVGAVLVRNQEIIGQGHNRPISLHDPTAHAEIQAIRDAAQKIGNYRLNGTSLYVTLEPCAMCAGAIIQARIARVVFGAYDLKTGAVQSVFNLLQHESLNHRCVVREGILAKECSQLLTAFFQGRRKQE